MMIMEFWMTYIAATLKGGKAVESRYELFD